MRVSHNRAHGLKFFTGRRVGRPINGVVGPGMAGEVPRRWLRRAQRVKVPKEIVAIFDAEARDAGPALSVPGGGFTGAVPTCLRSPSRPHHL
jgi:hypothetical protein